MRQVHYEGVREAQNVRDAPTSEGGEYRFKCRHCGADHGQERHFGDCPECDETPDGRWSSTMVAKEESA